MSEQIYNQEEEIDFSYIENAKKPVGELGRTVLDNMNQGHAELTRWGFDHILFGDSVLDIGCGGGNALNLAMHKNPGAQYFGIDYSDIAIEKATSFNGEAVMSGRLILKKADVGDLPFEDNFFDTAYSIESYFFWPDLDGALQEVCRVLRKGGTFAIIVEMVSGNMNPTYQKIAEHMHMNVLEPDGLQKKFETCGFHEVRYDWDMAKGWLVIQGKKA